MATLKRQRTDGTWEYIQLSGQDVASLVNSLNSQSSKLTAHLEDSHLHKESLSKFKSGIDANGNYTVVEYKNKTTNAPVAKSVLSGGTSPNYTTRTITYYGPGGAVVKTETYTLTYDSDGGLVGEV